MTGHGGLGHGLGLKACVWSLFWSLPLFGNDKDRLA